MLLSNDSQGEKWDLPASLLAPPVNASVPTGSSAALPVTAPGEALDSDDEEAACGMAGTPPCPNANLVYLLKVGFCIEAS